MIVGALITDGGPHPADKWAEATASQIVEIADHVAGERRAAGVKLQAAIIDILTGHHTTVQDGERAKIAEVGHDRLTHGLDAGEHIDVDSAVAEIVAAAQGTPWEADLQSDEACAYLKALLASHFHTSMQIERSWHADRNPEMEQARAFRSTYHPGA